MYTIFNISDKNKKTDGSWRTWDHNGKNRVLISCPGCGTEAGIDHDVADDGIMTPSLVCPNNCGFHEHVKLVGWGGGIYG